MFFTLWSSFCNGRATSALFHIRRANLKELSGDVDNDVSKWEALGTLAYGVSQNSGYLSRGTNDKDYRILGCLLGSASFGKLPSVEFKGSLKARERRFEKL